MDCKKRVLLCHAATKWFISIFNLTRNSQSYKILSTILLKIKMNVRNATIKMFFKHKMKDKYFISFFGIWIWIEQKCYANKSDEHCCLVNANNTAKWFASACYAVSTIYTTAVSLTYAHTKSFYGNACLE